MEISQNEIYTLIDEDFLAQFSSVHRKFLEGIYYSEYLSLCEHIERNPLTKTEFFTNMRRRRFQFFQLCCPYCGETEILVQDKRVQHSNGFNYCPSCGRGSVQDVVSTQLSRFTRISCISNAGISLYKIKQPESDVRLLAYDIYQMQLIELTSILEVILRDFFEALLHMSYLGIKNSYTEKIVHKSIGNDFMQIEKANEHYKKAFGIDIKTAIGQTLWDNLVDITNMRNMMIHNNGIVDGRFKNTKTYDRVKALIEGDLLILNEDVINDYHKDILSVSAIISDIFRENYVKLRNKTIVLHYFASSDILSADVE